MAAPPTSSEAPSTPKLARRSKAPEPPLQYTGKASTDAVAPWPSSVIAPRISRGPAPTKRPDGMLTLLPSSARSISSCRAAAVRCRAGSALTLASLALIPCASPLCASSSSTASRPLASSRLSTCAVRPLRCAAPCSPCSSTRDPFLNLACSALAAAGAAVAPGVATGCGRAARGSGHGGAHGGRCAVRRGISEGCGEWGWCGAQLEPVL